MSEIKNGGLGQYGAEPFEQRQFGTAGVERVKVLTTTPHQTYSSESSLLRENTDDDLSLICGRFNNYIIDVYSCREYIKVYTVLCLQYVAATIALNAQAMFVLFWPFVDIFSRGVFHLETFLFSKFFFGGLVRTGNCPGDIVRGQMSGGRMSGYRLQVSVCSGYDFWHSG